MSIRILAALAALTFFAACSTAGRTEPAKNQPMSKAEISAKLDEADSIRKKAAELKHEWRFTGKYIKEGRELLKQGNLPAAQAKAKKALLEAKTAVLQHGLSKETWKLAVP